MCVKYLHTDIDKNFSFCIKVRNKQMDGLKKNRKKEERDDKKTEKNKKKRRVRKEAGTEEG